MIHAVTREPILWLTEAEGNSIVGTHNSFDFRDDEPVVTAIVAKWDIQELEPVEVYWENSFVFDFQSITPLIENSYFAQAWASDRQGHVFLAPRSSEEYLITGYGPDGEVLCTISRDLPRVRKGEEELLDETAFWKQRAENMGATGPFDYEPDPPEGYQKLYVMELSR